MKKIKKLLKALWTDRHGLISALSYILVVGWYGYAIVLIKESEIWLIPKILMIVGGLVLGFFACVNLSNAFSEDDE